MMQVHSPSEIKTIFPFFVFLTLPPSLPSSFLAIAPSLSQFPGRLFFHFRLFSFPTESRRFAAVAAHDKKIATFAQSTMFCAKHFLSISTSASSSETRQKKLLH
jgi:hypothetical protein